MKREVRRRGLGRFVAAGFRVPALVLIAFAAVGVFALLEFGVRPASAQFFGLFEQQRPRRQAPPQQRQQFFPFPFFGGNTPSYQQPWDDRPTQRARPQQQRNDARAPAHKRPEVEPAKNVLVFGDSMADWLSYGLEEAFAETNELGVTRKVRQGAGLIRNEQRDYDWAQAIKEATERADFVVIMTGLSDRKPIRERVDAKPNPKDRRAKPGEKPNERDADPEATTIIAEPERGANASGSHEFRSEKWSELYGKRIDEVIEAAKAKRVPVIWVGLPPVRGPRARSEVPVLNDIYKLSAEKNGVTYVDVWEGFAGDDGDFTLTGPDVIGQVRRLRSPDGVHFTPAGARKLAHYVDREIKRMMSRELPLALPIPSEPQRGEPQPAGPAARPLAGPVIALTGGTAPREEALVGATREARAEDPLAVSVMVRGEALPGLPGRADYFAWPSPYTVADNDVAEPPALPAAAVAARPQPARQAEPAASASNTGNRGTRPSAASAVGPTPRSRAVR
ncbi:hypothetical protein GJW-30_1_00242 [Variibacter gotjawalensis]|uniref:Uncharacterized protein n=1 Tax=Variibacter gotjawalensis TaxID=1333996 RepID=A0A0S3PP53_9BRAD|nr:hypothetical protein EV661_2352 [Variibacter gotjawalensis]BAT57734.1 hypothetical protein GJW-30_1_00242 [Variibacter gotjawalensis]